jgi:hypothetical protein
MKRNIGKKTWGVLGKQQTYFYQPGLVAKNGKTPLNANAFEPWDAKKSKYRRVDLVPRPMENDAQQAGVVGTESSPVPSPTPTITKTSTPTNTATNTPSPTRPIPVPSLWYDASDVSTLTLTNSGGTNYITSWTSKGSVSKTLTASTINSAPIYSGSSTLPSSPNVVRFTENITVGNRDFLASQYNSNFISNSGSTIFQVLAKPTNATVMAASFRFYSGNTTGGFVAPSTKLIINSVLGLNGLQQSQVIGYTGPNNGFVLPNTTAYTRGDNYLITNVSAVNNGEFMSSYVNEFYSASTTAYVALTAGTGTNAVLLNGTVASTGVITAANSSNEVAEILYYNRVLSPSEITQVQNYLKIKWNYTNWIATTATPTPTNTNTQTPTPSITPTKTATPTLTPSPTPSTGYFDADAATYLNAVVSAGGTGITSTVSAATNNMFISLKSANIYNKIDALYPFLGGTASSCKWNAKNPVDTNAAFRLTFGGGGIFSQQRGYKCNAINAFADTFWVQSGQTTTGNTSIGTFVSVSGTQYDMGSSTSSQYLAFASSNGTSMRGGIETGLTNFTAQTNTQAINFNAISRINNSNVLFVASGGAVQSIASIGTSTLQNISINIGQVNGAGLATDRGFGSVFIAEGLTSTELGNLRDIITTFNTTLGRNI